MAGSWPAAATRVRVRWPMVQSPACFAPASACPAEPIDSPRSKSPSGWSWAGCSTCRRPRGPRRHPARRCERPRALPRCPGNRAAAARRRTAARQAWVDDLHLADEPSRAALAIGPPAPGAALPLPVGRRREDLYATSFGHRRRSRPDRWRDRRVARPAGSLVIADLVRRPDPRRGRGLGRVVDRRPCRGSGRAFRCTSWRLRAARRTGPGRRGASGPSFVIASRLSARRPARCRSGIGDRAVVDLPTVRAASGRTEEETIEALEELIRRGIVRVSLEGPGGAVATTSATAAARRRVRGDEPGPSAASSRRTAQALRDGQATIGDDLIAASP